MSIEVRPHQIQGTIRRSIRPDRIVVGAVLVVAIALSGASLFADPTSAITLAMAALYGAVGALLAIRRPRNPIGWIFLAILLVFTSTTAADGLGGQAVRSVARCPAGCPWP